jgi:hypothetical protein
MLTPTEQRNAEAAFALWMATMLASQQVMGTGADQKFVPVLMVPMEEVVELFKKQNPDWAQAKGLENKYPRFANYVPLSDARWNHEKSKVTEYHRR